MKFVVRVFAALVLLAALRLPATPPPGYYEVWGDEFNGTSLNPAYWWVWNQPDRSGYSTPSAVTVSNGYMTILVYSTNGQNYSGIVSSDARFRCRYGYSEASVEFNGSPGMFSDFWLNSADNGSFIGDPAAEGAEVDICEHRVTDANNADNISGNVTIDLHWNGYGSAEQSFNSPLYGSGLGTGFHTYGLLWSPTNYSASIDGVLTMQTNAGVSQRTEIILFSCEVDSNSFCGIVPTGGYGNASTSTTSTVVDYYRFYAPTTTLYYLGTSSTSWTDPGNWVSNMVPAANSDIVFSYLSTANFAFNLTSNTTVNSLSIQETPGLSFSGSPLTVNGGGIDMISAINNSSISSPLVVGASQTWNVGSGIALIVSGPISGAGNVALDQLGEVVMAGTNNSSGTTIVSNGTLYVSGVVNNQTVVAGGTVTGTGTLAGAVTVNSGTLTGNPIITAPVVVNAGGALGPGSPTGTMTVNNSLTLQPGSSTVININQSTGACGQVSGLASVSYGGTLIVSNLSGTLAAGNSFQVFNAGSYSGAFSRISPATPGPNLAWSATALNTLGLLQVVATNSTSITAQTIGISKSQVSLSWPSDHIGWLLQSQTNSAGHGITGNWTTIPGSLTTNVMAFPVNPVVGSVFYRLACPSYSTAVFGAGDLIVLQVGNGSINSTGAPGVLYDFSPFGGPSPVQISLPTTGSSALIFGGSSYDGVLSLAVNGQSIVMEGYNIAVGGYGSAIDSSSTTAVPRGVGSINANGGFTLNATTTQFSGSTIRSAGSDGAGNFWAGGGSSGVVYLGSNSPAATVSTVSGATRDMAIFNGNIYSTTTGDGNGVMGFSGEPKTSSSPTLIVNTAGLGSGTISPKGFAFNPAMTIAYVADNRSAATGGGMQRFNWSGSAWVYAYTLTNKVTSSTEVEDLAVNFSGANPILYTTTGEGSGNSLITATDTGASSAFTVLETAASGDAFRGVTFAPTAP